MIYKINFNPSILYLIHTVHKYYIYFISNKNLSKIQLKIHLIQKLHNVKSYIKNVTTLLL